MKASVAVVLLSGSFALSQSGRIKPNETPTPTPTPTPRRAQPEYLPTDTVTPIAESQSKKSDSDVIKVNSNLVPIPVSVFDQFGRPVTNLSQEDFELLVDGKEAEIGEVEKSQSAVNLLLLFDNSSSVTIAREFEKTAAVKFLETVLRRDRDLAALMSISTTWKLEQQFTNDLDRLIYAVNNFPSPLGATALLDGLYSASNLFSSLKGRRVVVIVSDGVDTISDTTFDSAVKSLVSANVQVFVVKTTDYENFKRTESRDGSANLKQLAAERRMQELVRQTGGTVHSPLNDEELINAFTRISTELSDQYVIGFYPSDENDYSIKMRSVSVRIKNHPELTVKTRLGYYGPR
jgi:Ca-activated chloride channel family protein